MQACRNARVSLPVMGQSTSLRRPFDKLRERLRADTLVPEPVEGCQPGDSTAEFRQSIRGRAACQSAAWSGTATGLESSDTLISRSRQLASNASDCSIARAAINLRQKAPLGKTCTPRLFLLYDLRQKRLIDHNGPCACRTLPLLLGPVVVTSGSAGDRSWLNSFRYSHLPSDNRLPYLLHPFCRNSRSQSLR